MIKGNGHSTDRQCGDCRETCLGCRELWTRSQITPFEGLHLLDRPVEQRIGTMYHLGNLLYDAVAEGSEMVDPRIAHNIAQALEVDTAEKKKLLVLEEGKQLL